MESSTTAFAHDTARAIAESLDQIEPERARNRQARRINEPRPEPRWWGPAELVDRLRSMSRRIDNDSEYVIWRVDPDTRKQLLHAARCVQQAKPIPWSVEYVGRLLDKYLERKTVIDQRNLSAKAAEKAARIAKGRRRW